jgi:hypothetical protein
MILMNIVLLGIAITCLMLVPAFVLLLRRIVSPARFAPFSLEWINSFNAERYRPMARLLIEDDFHFLASRSVNPKVLRKMRAQRRRMFRGYLSSMRRDFARICQGIKLLMVNSRQDRPDLATVLLKQQVLFGWRMTVVEVRLVLHAAGLASVDAAELLSPLNALRMQFNGSMLPVGAGA